MTVLDDFRLDGRVALVTGAGRGLGQALAVGLAEAGADVAVLDVIPLDETREQITALGRKCHAMGHNLLGANAGLASQIVSECVSELGRIDILVNNAGIIRRAPALEFSEEDWDDVVSINLTSLFYLSQAAARRFVEQGGGGKIINLASVLSFSGRSEEHTSELQSRQYLVCRLLLEKKKTNTKTPSAPPLIAACILSATHSRANRSRPALSAMRTPPALTSPAPPVSSLLPALTRLKQ